MQSRKITLKDISINIIEAGQGGKELILFCHGFPETSYAWRHQLDALATAGYHAVAMDMRGYGSSSAPVAVSEYSIDKLVGDVIGVIKALGYEKALLVGNDWGSTVVWQTALLHPEYIKGVAVFGVPMMGRAPVAPSVIFSQVGTDEFFLYTMYFQAQGVAEEELSRDIESALMKIYYAASGEAGPRDQPDTPNPFGMVPRHGGWLAALPEKRPSWLSAKDMEIYSKSFAQSGFHGALNYYRNLDANWEAQLAYEDLKVLVPAMYMVGERDTGLAIPGMMDIIDAMPAMVPDLRKSLIISGAGHWLQQEAPAEVNEALLDFIKQL